MTAQGWPLSLIQLVNSFLTDRHVRVRLEDATTPYHKVACGTPQGSPLSLVLYMLYLAELLAKDTTLRFGYADDICLYRATPSLEDNVQLLADDVNSIIRWGARNKVAFAPEKLEMIHLTKKNGLAAPPCRVNDELTIHPILSATKEGDQPALRWLGVWFDRKLAFRRHVAERAAKARQVARHIRSLARTSDGPPASALRKAVITCILPSILYGTEAWYAGRHKPARPLHGNRTTTVSARLGWHVDLVDKTIALAARGVLPVWRTTPTITLFRDAGLPSGMAALEDAKLRFATRLQTVEACHPLVQRIQPPLIVRGRGAGTQRRPKTKIQQLGTIIPPIPRPTLRPPHFTTRCRTSPTGGLDKTTASNHFKRWWAALPYTDVTIFSDGSEQQHSGARKVGYGYAVYQNGRQIASGHGAINPLSHVFDAEAIGAWKALQHTLRLPPDISQRRLWLCIDSTSVIWCLRGDAPYSSQWAFIACQEAMQCFDIGIRWSPGHTGIQGNEAADKLADLGAQDTCDTGQASQPTASGIRSVYRDLRTKAQQAWWTLCSTQLSTWYNKWNLIYQVKPLPELDLPRMTLHRLLAIRSSHGDFSWYHTKFAHEDAQLLCSCGRPKTPDHIIHCRKTTTPSQFRYWPQRPEARPNTPAAGIEYLTRLMAKPADFATFLQATEFYTTICPC